MPFVAAAPPAVVLSYDARCAALRARVVILVYCADEDVFLWAEEHQSCERVCALVRDTCVVLQAWELLAGCSSPTTCPNDVPFSPSSAYGQLCGGGFDRHSARSDWMATRRHSVVYHYWSLGIRGVFGAQFSELNGIRALPMHAGPRVRPL